jgi:hypothetical protein
MALDEGGPEAAIGQRIAPTLVRPILIDRSSVPKNNQQHDPSNKPYYDNPATDFYRRSADHPEGTGIVSVTRGLKLA